MIELAEAPSSEMTRSRSLEADAPPVAPNSRATSDSSRALLGLLALAETAANDIADGSPELTLDGVISKTVLRSLLGALHQRDVATVR
ncbi:MAG: hypothetical protein H7062_06955, partial [Candidatus Saccharimonas sp.]|nr:hypothetical protein [Planctomycetaceae bacterium]